MKIKSMMFQSAVGIPGTKIASELSIHPDKFPGVHMLLKPEGVLISVPKVDGTRLMALVPLANIRYMIVETEEESLGKPTRITK